MLAETFLAKFQPTPVGTLVVIDSLAQELGVERRRIYDVVNILEAVQVVTKKAKNTYQWMGTGRLPEMLALLQHEAIQTFPREALKNGLVTNTENTDTSNFQCAASKSLSRLSQLFLQVFLVGNLVLSLPEASDKIHGGSTSLEELAAMGTPAAQELPTDPRQFQQAATRGLKTKIRRLYDIANVYCAVGMFQKKPDKLLASEDVRPQYQWSFGETPAQILQRYDSLTTVMKREKTPFGHDNVPCSDS